CHGLEDLRGDAPRFESDPATAPSSHSRTELLYHAPNPESEAILRSPESPFYFFGEVAGLGAAFGAAAAPGVGAGFASSSSTSKIRVELALRSGLTALSP